MAKNLGRISLKQVMIDKSNSTMVMIAGAAAFVAVFSLVASKSLVDQMLYQNRVISAKKESLQLLSDNLNARNQLVKSYNSFQSRSINIIGGSSIGSGGNNGDNATIITDALPYKYDFPALVTSLEKMITDNKLTITAIDGTDDEIQQKTNVASNKPESVAMPFEVQVTGDYAGLQQLIFDFQRSIRPFVVQKVKFTSAKGVDKKMGITITAQTYYQPGVEFKIPKEVIQ